MRSYQNVTNCAQRSQRLATCWQETALIVWPMLMVTHGKRGLYSTKRLVKLIVVSVVKLLAHCLHLSLARIV
jgi:hypothetical protein